MFSNRSAFIGLGVACVLAAAAGSYLATRHAAESGAIAAPMADSPAAVRSPVSDVVPAAPSASVEAEASRHETAAREEVSRPNPLEESKSPRRVRRTAASQTTARASEPALARRSGPDSAPSERQVADQPLAVTSSSDLTPVEPRFDPPLSVPEARSVQPESPARADLPEAPQFHELVVAAESVMGLHLETTVSSEHARVEDTVEARVARDVRVGRLVAVPAGSHVLGSVVAVDRGGKFKDRARVGIRFHTLMLADGSRVPITTETIFRYGGSPGDSSAKKIGGGAVAGAILGAIIGGAKGAAVGATAGAGGGTAVVMAGERHGATFAAGSEVTARILAPITVTVGR